MGQEIQLKLNNNNVSPTVEKVGDGNLQGFTATDLTGAANELKNTLNTYVRPNLLDNWYFVYGKAINNDYSSNGTFPVNQRNVRSYQGNGTYGIDRWLIYGNHYVTVQPTGIEVANTTGNYGGIVQVIENGIANLSGKIVTLSCLYKRISGNVPGIGVFYGNKNAGTAIQSVSLNAELSTTSLGSVTFTVPSSGLSDDLFVRYLTYNNIADVLLIAVKLELGSTQTLAHLEGSTWVLNEIPNYDDQILRCCSSKADSNNTYANKPYNELRNTLNQLDTEVDTVENGLAIPQTGNTCTKTGGIPKGAFIFLQGHSTLTDGIYQNTSGSIIANGATFTSSNLTRCYQETGTLNLLNSGLMATAKVYRRNLASSSNLNVVFYPTDVACMVITSGSVKSGYGTATIVTGYVTGSRLSHTDLKSESTLGYDFTSTTECKFAIINNATNSGIQVTVLDFLGTFKEWSGGTPSEY